MSVILAQQDSFSDASLHPRDAQRGYIAEQKRLWYDERAGMFDLMCEAQC
jgi:hypothetical protein